MREGLRGLTGRGRALVAVGLGVLLGAWVFGQRDLLRVAVLLLALPLLSVALVARTRYRLACARALSPTRLPVGSTATSTVVLENVSRLPTGLLLAEDAVPRELGEGPRVVLDRVEPLGRREVSYELRGAVRGRYTVGPLAVRLADPFGLVSLTRSFTATDLLLVTPEVHALPAVPLGGEWSGQGESRARSLASSGDDDVVPREYRVGDELRRVHWRATARYGDLMVRREEQPWRSRATLVLDTRDAAQRGDGPTSSFEWALSAAASIAVHLIHRGWLLRLVDGSGTPLLGMDESDAGGSDLEGFVLDALAVLTPSPSRQLGLVDPQTRRNLGDGLVVAVLGRTNAEETAAVARLRPGGSAGLAVAMDVAAWGSGAAADAGSARTRAARAEDRAAAEAAAALLRGAGWRAAVATPEDPVTSLWPQLARGVGAHATLPAAGTAGRVPTPAAGVGGRA